jgi:hypothetical protein
MFLRHYEQINGDPIDRRLKAKDKKGFNPRLSCLVTKLTITLAEYSEYCLASGIGYRRKRKDADIYRGSSSSLRNGPSNYREAVLYQSIENVARSL